MADIDNVENNYGINNVSARKKWRKAMIGIFGCIVLFLFITGLCFWLRPEESSVEKRKLAERPAVTVSGLMDGSWFSGWVTWYSDTYPLRDALIRLDHALSGLDGIYSRGAIYGSAVQSGQSASTAENTGSGNSVSEKNGTGNSQTGNAGNGGSAVLSSSGSAVSSGSAASSGSAGSSGSEASSVSGTAAASSSENGGGTINDIPEVAGTIYITDGQGVELYYFSQDNADYYANDINMIKDNLGEDINVYDMVVPTSFGVCLSRDVQESLTGTYQGDAISYIYGRLDSDVIKIPVYDSLVSHNSEYEYFRTDHHWTALGAYYAYLEFCSAKGIMPEVLKSFETMEFPDFLGSYYAYSNQSQELADNPDTVIAYIPHDTNDMTYTTADGNTYSGNIISDVSQYSEDNKYLAFINGDQPFEHISNPKREDGESCVVVKESFGNAFVPFLVDHYKDIYVIDYRYYKNDLTDFCRKNSIDDVIFINNAEAVTPERADTMLSLFPAE